MSFQVGDRVVLPAFENIEEERGVVEATEGRRMYMVRVNKRTDRYDDRIREVHESGMRKEKA